MNLESNDIKLFRDYLLTQDEGVRNQLIKFLPPKTIANLITIQEGLLSGSNLSELVASVGAESLKNEIEQLQLEYFCSLAELKLSGELNSEIRRLVDNHNKLFNEILETIPNQKEFEIEMSFGLALVEREIIKKKLLIVDDLDAIDLDENELSEALSFIERSSFKEKFKRIDEEELIQVLNEPPSVYQPSSSFNMHSKQSIVSKDESKTYKRPYPVRVIFAYAAAATFFGIIILVMLYKPHVNSNNVTIANHKSEDVKSATNNNFSLSDLGIITPEKRTIKAPVNGPQSLGFSLTKQKEITIIVEDYSKVYNLIAVHLKNQRSMQAELSERIGPRAGKLKANKALYEDTVGRRQQVLNDSDTYLFDVKRNSLHLKLIEHGNVGKLLSIDGSNERLFISIDGNYYGLMPNKSYQKLQKVTDNAILSQLERIAFENN